MENTLALIFGLTMLNMSATSRMKSYLKMLSIQGLLLFLIFYTFMEQFNALNFCFLAFETLGIKMIIIPLFIWRIIKKGKIYRDTSPSIPKFYSLVASTIILFSGFILPVVLKKMLINTNSLSFGVALSTIIISLFFITIRKKVITGVIGYIMMENGIFLLSLSVGKEMPIIVNMGVLLDLFIAVFILGLLVQRIGRTFENDNMNSLKVLKDSGDAN